MGEALEVVKKINWKTLPDDQVFHYLDLTSVKVEVSQIGETSKINARTAPSRAQQLVASGDVLFGSTRPMLKRVCRIPSEFDSQICSTGFTVLRAKKDSINPDFLFHIVNSNLFYRYVEAKQQGASYPSISDREVKAFEIPLPSIETQKEIAEFLNSFEGLVNDISSGLPAEIAARRQQYEYYRDKLLSLKEIEAA